MLVSYIASVVIGLIFVYRSKLLDFIKINSNEENILLEIYIPRIKLKKCVYNIDSSLNDVDYNVEILEASDVANNLFFLAAHSGSGQASYFDDLVYLEKGDIIWVNKNEEKYGFVVEEMFYIQKDGYFNVSYNVEGNMLFLITCSLKYVDRQLIIRSRLIYEC